MTAAVSPAFVFDDEQVEVEVLIKQVNDIQDARNPTNPITVSISGDGTGVMVKEPSLPHWMSHWFDKLYEECESIEIESDLITNHLVSVTSIKQMHSRKM